MQNPNKACSKFFSPKNVLRKCRLAGFGGHRGQSSVASSWQRYADVCVHAPVGTCAHSPARSRRRPASYARPLSPPITLPFAAYRPARLRSPSPTFLHPSHFAPPHNARRGPSRIRSSEPCEPRRSPVFSTCAVHGLRTSSCCFKRAFRIRYPHRPTVPPPTSGIR